MKSLMLYCLIGWEVTSLFYKTKTLASEGGRDYSLQLTVDGFCLLSLVLYLNVICVSKSTVISKNAMLGFVEIGKK